MILKLILTGSQGATIFSFSWNLFCVGLIPIKATNIYLSLLNIFPAKEITLTLALLLMIQFLFWVQGTIV